MLSSAASLLALAGLAPAISPQGRVLVVDHLNGPFFDLQSAVDAAQERDTLLVKTGNYLGFTIDDKGINVVADTSASVHVTSLVRVRNLEAKKTVVLAGLAVAPNGVHGADAVDLESDLGSVRIESCDFDAWHATAGGPGAIATSARDVSFTFVHITSGPADSAYHPGRSGLAAISSRIALYDGEVRGGRGADDCPTGDDGGSGVLLGNSSFLFALRGRFYGGRGGNGDGGGFGCSCGADGGTGGAGLQIQSSSTAFLVGGHLEGGAGGQAFVGPCGGVPGSPGPSIVGGRFSMSASVGPSLSVPNPVRELASFQVVVGGLPGDTVYLSIAGDTSFRPLSGDQGVLLLRDPQPPLFLGTIGASGTLTTPLSFPDLGPGVDSRNVFLQAAVRSVAGTWRLTDLSSLIVLDRAF